MKRHLYPWYSWPGRAVMLVWSLAKSFLGDWRPWRRDER